jgi:predicted dinucleotide-binding enzyme
MINPAKAGRRLTMLMCGNNNLAKQSIATLLADFDWSGVIRLGGIKNARGTEMMHPVWLSLWHAFQYVNFAFAEVRPS